MSQPPKQLKLAFFASGNGSNLQAILDACASSELDMSPQVVISNNSKAYALTRGQLAGIGSHHFSSKTHPHNLDQTILNTLLEHSVDLIVLVGYMKKLGDEILERFRGRVLNIHPALLPEFGGHGMYGLKVHQAVVAAGATHSGATVHLVDSEYDTGPILSQARIPLSSGETPESLAAKVLALEHRLLVETLQKIASGELELEGLKT